MAPSWQGLLSVAVGGALGSVLRWLVALAAARWFGAGFPAGTLLVNLAGSLAIGVVAGWAPAGAYGVTAGVRLFVVVGILGGFTTFSSFSLDAVALAGEGRTLAAAGYVAASVGLGLAACVAGVALARATLPR